MPQPKRRGQPTRFGAALVMMLTVSLVIYVLSPEGRVRMVLGSRTFHLLSRIDRVQPFRIDPNWVQDPKGPVIGQNGLAMMGVDFKGFVITATGNSQGMSFAGELASILSDAQTYQGSNKSCDFSPTIAYRLRAGDGTLELLLDFQCNRLQLLTRDARGQATHSVFGDFDRYRASLSALTTRALPESGAPSHTIGEAP